MSSGGTRFSVSGSTVTGSGQTPQSASDHFYGAAGAGYSVTIAPGADLFNHFAISSNGTPSAGTLAAPGGELVVVDHGSITNNGTLNVFPVSVDPPGTNGCDFCQTGGVIYITGSSGDPSSVVNRGVIGDRVLGSSFGGTTAEHGYGQIDSFGVLMMNGTVVNDPGAIITGNNAIFTQGNAASNRIDNYGVIDASNDGVISSYLIVNHPGGAINTGVAGFACVHAYGDVTNDGYMLGEDYGMLLEGTNTQIADYGGPLVAGVRNFDGSPVYNGEISAILRSTGKINSGGPYRSGDAVMMDTENSTLSLHTTLSGSKVWLPVVNGPLVGGFNGDFDSASAHQTNTLAFDFSGLSAAELASLRSSVARSAVRNANGTYFSGQADVLGHAYHWVDWAAVTVSGVPGAPVVPRDPGKAHTGRRTHARKYVAIFLGGRPAALNSLSVGTTPPATPAVGIPASLWVNMTAIFLLTALVVALVVVAIRRGRDRTDVRGHGPGTAQPDNWPQPSPPGSSWGR